MDKIKFTVTQKSQVSARPPFVHGHVDEIYLYSAIAHGTRGPGSSSVLKVMVTTMDMSKSSLNCCVLRERDNVPAYVTSSSVYFQVSDSSPSIYVARQYKCSVPSPGAPPRFVTLTSSPSCSSNISDYIPIIYPEIVPNGLALCAKIAFSPGLDTQKVVEWFEMQRELGVDRILIFNLGVDDAINRIFRYYQNLGLLEIQPYALPGEPKNRNLNESFKRTAQFNHDESMSLLDCKQRMSGYDFVLSHDLDEMVIPRDNVSLKTFFKGSLSKHPDAAGFFFDTSFFITDWTPSNPEEKLLVKRYRISREPRWECYKFVYIPERVKSILTHSVFAQQGYNTHRLSQKEVILHHYRRCPADTWGTCNVTTVTDDVMMRYRELDQRVFEVLSETQGKK
ncbi:hypothetical protein Btru_050626 [Bulinus truncatus]|nr:hypothetical protein Btru_050626 [Bulinus truncatus]